MKSILEELYNGSVYPAELICFTDPDYRPLNRELGEMKKSFTSDMSTDDRKRFERIEYLYCRSSSMEATESFVYGFQLAALMMIEVYNGKGQITRNEE